MQEILEIVKIFSVPELPVEKQIARVYVTVKNKSTSTDFFGKVAIECAGKTYGSEQVISIFKDSNQDGVWFDDSVSEGGLLNCKIKVYDSLNKLVVNSEEKIKFDIDTDGDAIGNTNDKDDDNDGLTDEEEIKLGTNTLLGDTDGDGQKDGDEVKAGTNPNVKNEIPFISNTNGSGLSSSNNIVNNILSIPAVNSATNFLQNILPAGNNTQSNNPVTSNSPNSSQNSNINQGQNSDENKIKTNYDQNYSNTNLNNSSYDGGSDDVRLGGNDESGPSLRESILQFKKDIENKSKDYSYKAVKINEEAKENTYNQDNFIFKYKWHIILFIIIFYIFYEFIKYKIYKNKRKEYKLDK